MGGFSGKVRGKTKISTYERYREKAEEWGLGCDPNPDHKKECKSRMVRDEEREEWILEFRFDK